MRVTAARFGEALFRKCVEMALDLGDDLHKTYGSKSTQDKGLYRLELVAFVMFPMDLILHANRDSQFGEKAGEVRAAYLDSMLGSCRAQGWTEPQVKQLGSFVAGRLGEYAGAMSEADREADEGKGPLQALGLAACRNILGVDDVDPLIAAHLSMHFAASMKAFQDVGQQYEIV